MSLLGRRVTADNARDHLRANGNTSRPGQFSINDDADSGGSRSELQGFLFSDGDTIEDAPEPPKSRASRVRNRRIYTTK